MRSVRDDEPSSKVVVSSWSASEEEEEENGSTRSTLWERQNRADSPIHQPQPPQPDKNNNNDKDEDSFSVETLRDELERWKQSLHLFDTISHDSSTARGNHNIDDETATSSSTTPAKYNHHHLRAERHEYETEARVSPQSAFLHDVETTENDEYDSNDDNDGCQPQDRWHRRWDWSSHPQEDAEEEDPFVVPAVLDDHHKPRTDSRRRRRYESTNRDNNNYRTPDTSFISNTEKTTTSTQEQPQVSSTPGPPPPVETPARPAPPRRSGLDYCNDEDGDNDRNGTRTDRRFRREPELDLDRRNQTNNNGRARGCTSSSTTTTSSDAAAVREAAPSPDDKYAVDHSTIDDEEEGNDGWQQRVLTAALHRQEDYIQALELENEQLRNNLQQQSRRRQRRQGIDVSDEDNLAASPWFTSPGTRFVAELATVMPLPEEYYGPLSRIMDKYYDDDRRPVAPQEKNYPSHPWWRR